METELGIIIAIGGIIAVAILGLFLKKIKK